MVSLRHPPAVSDALPILLGGFLAALLAVFALLIIDLLSLSGFRDDGCTDIGIASSMMSYNGPVWSAIDTFRLDVGEYPVRLDDLVERPSSSQRALRWNGPYFKEKADLLDPWGHMIQYRCPGVVNPGGFDLFSLGPDGVEGTGDDIMGEKAGRNVRKRWPGIMGLHPLLGGFIAASMALLVLLLIKSVASSWSDGCTSCGDEPIWSWGAIASAIDTYRIDMGEYPVRLQDLLERPADEERAVHWNGPYLRDAAELTDPEGRMAQYRCPGVRNPEFYDLFILTSDGTEKHDIDIPGEVSPR